MILVNQFTGDGATSAFALSDSPPADAAVLVAIDGVTQLVDAYSLSGTTLTFAAAPANGAAIEARFGSQGLRSADVFTGDGTTTDFDLSAVPASDGDALVSIDGVMQRIQAYDLLGSTISFTAAPPAGAAIEVRHGFDALEGANAFTGDGSTTVYQLSFVAAADDRVVVVIDGVFQHTAAYNVAGATLTFTTAPASGAKIEVRRLKSNPSPFRGACVLNTVSIPGSGIVVWVTIGYDTGGFWSAGSASRLTVPAGVNRARISAQAVHAGDGTGTGALSLAIRRNGAVGYSGDARQTVDSADLTTATALNAQTPAIEVAAGDYFELDLAAPSGTWDAATTWFALDAIE